MPRTETRSNRAPVVSFRPADPDEHAMLQRDAADAGMSPSEYLRALVRQGGDARRAEDALLDALRRTGATASFAVRRGKAGAPPTVQVVDVTPRDADPFGAIVDVVMEPARGGTYSLLLEGVRGSEWEGARLLLAVLPARLNAVVNVPFADLGALRQVAP